MSGDLWVNTGIEGSAMRFAFFPCEYSYFDSSTSPPESRMWALLLEDGLVTVRSLLLPGLSLVVLFVRAYNLVYCSLFNFCAASCLNRSRFARAVRPNCRKQRYKYIKQSSRQFSHVVPCFFRPPVAVSSPPFPPRRFFCFPFCFRRRHRGGHPVRRPALPAWRGRRQQPRRRRPE